MLSNMVGSTVARRFSTIVLAEDTLAKKGNQGLTRKDAAMGTFDRFVEDIVAASLTSAMDAGQESAMQQRDLRSSSCPLHANDAAEEVAAPFFEAPQSRQVMSISFCTPPYPPFTNLQLVQIGLRFHGRQGNPVFFARRQWARVSVGLG